MPVELHPCVREVLCALEDEALAPVRATIAAVSGATTALLAVAQANLASLELVTSPLTLARETAQQVIDAARGTISGLPFGVGQCIDLGDLLVKLDSYAARITRPLDEFKAWADTQLDRLDVLRIEIAALEADIEFYTAILSAIDACSLTA